MAKSLIRPSLPVKGRRRRKECGGLDLIGDWVAQWVERSASMRKVPDLSPSLAAALFPFPITLKA